MANFFYKAKTNLGKDTQGFVEATDQKQALAVLKEKGLVCYSLSIKDETVFTELGRKFFGKISFNDVVMFTRQLATMINAGLPLTDSLSILKSQGSAKLSEIVSQILRDVKEGSSLAESIKKYPAVFSQVYIALVRAGEAAGIIDNILNRLADNLENQREFNGKLKNAMIYPIIILLAMTGVIFGMMVFVIPKLTVLYDEFKADLPATTKGLIALSNFMSHFWWLILAVVFGGFYLYRILNMNKEFREKIDNFKFKIPIYGPLYKKIILTEFTRTLGLLVNAGVSIVEALKISSKTANNIVIEKAILDATSQVEKGFTLSSALAQKDVFPQIVPQMISVGEETGEMGEVLAKVSKFFQSESDESVKGLTTAIEPLIMIVLGVGVLFLILAIILPIYNLTSSIK